MISVIVLNYNGQEFLKKCLNSLLSTDYPNFEVIFVDNASTDRSIKTVKKFFSKDSRLKLVENHKNLGFAEGNNVGARHAKGEYIVFLNIDTEVDRNWLKEIANVLDRDSSIGACQCKLLMTQDPNRLESTGHFVDYCGVESIESANVTNELDLGQYDKIRDIFYARGAAMVVKRSLFFKVGMFDPEYFVDHEEIDLCWRIRLRGYRIVYVPKSIVYHARGGASWQARKEKPAWITFHLRKNHITSLIKNYEIRNLIKYLSRYLIYLTSHAVYKMLKGDVKIPKAYFKAILWSILKFRYIYSQRQTVQHQIRRVPDKHVMKYMTKPKIPWHFLE